MEDNDILLYELYISNEGCANKVRYKPIEIKKCYFCNQQVNKICQSYIQHSCLQLLHNKCLIQISQEISYNLDPNILQQIRCFNCNEYFTFQQINTITNEFYDEKFAKKQASQLYREYKEENKQAALNKEFNCIICYNDKAKVIDGCYSVCDIDEHRFCKECLVNQILADYKKIDIKCCLCLELDESQRPKNYTVSIQTIQELLTKDQYNMINDYWSLYKMRNQKDENGENLYIQCIGFLKKGYQEGDKNMYLTQEEQNQIILHKKIKENYQIKECPGIMENNKNVADKDNQTCFICKLNFCSLCMNVRHENITCQQFKQWIKDNAIGDKGLEQIVNNGKFQQCGKCKNIVEKNEGCNHMTCRCGHQFCYICGQDYRNHDHQKCQRKDLKVQL